MVIIKVLLLFLFCNNIIHINAQVIKCKTPAGDNGFCVNPWECNLPMKYLFSENLSFWDYFNTLKTACEFTNTNVDVCCSVSLINKHSSDLKDLRDNITEQNLNKINNPSNEHNTENIIDFNSSELSEEEEQTEIRKCLNDTVTGTVNVDNQIPKHDASKIEQNETTKIESTTDSSNPDKNTINFNNNEPDMDIIFSKIANEANKLLNTIEIIDNSNLPKNANEQTKCNTTAPITKKMSVDVQIPIDSISLNNNTIIIINVNDKLKNLINNNNSTPLVFPQDTNENNNPPDSMNSTPVIDEKPKNFINNNNSTPLVFHQDTNGNNNPPDSMNLTPGIDDKPNNNNSTPFVFHQDTNGNNNPLNSMNLPPVIDDKPNNFINNNNSTPFVFHQDTNGNNNPPYSMNSTPVIDDIPKNFINNNNSTPYPDTNGNNNPPNSMNLTPVIDDKPNNFINNNNSTPFVFHQDTNGNNNPPDSMNSTPVIDDIPKNFINNNNSTPYPDTNGNNNPPYFMNSTPVIDDKPRIFINNNNSTPFVFHPDTNGNNNPPNSMNSSPVIGIPKNVRNKINSILFKKILGIIFCNTTSSQNNVNSSTENATNLLETFIKNIPWENKVESSTSSESITTTEKNNFQNLPTTSEEVDYITLPNPPDCGRNLKYMPKKGQYPWQVLLKEKNSNDSSMKQFCKGTLITKEHIVTTASCIKNREIESVLIHSQQNSEYVTLKIKNMKVHEHYGIHHIQHDIALIILDEPIKLEEISPICLKVDNDLTKNLTGVVGYVEGYINDTSENAAEPKMKTELIISQEECAEKLNVPKESYDYEKILCTKSKTDNHNTCLGNEGGPLMIRGKMNDEIYYYQIGILSKVNDCSIQNDYPGIFLNMNQYINWIIKNM